MVVVVGGWSRVSKSSDKNIARQWQVHWQRAKVDAVTRGSVGCGWFPDRERGWKKAVIVTTHCHGLTELIDSFTNVCCWLLKVSKSYVNGHLLGAVNGNKIENTFLCGVGTYSSIPLPQGFALLLPLTVPKPPLRDNMKIHFLSTAGCSQ